MEDLTANVTGNTFVRAMVVGKLPVTRILTFASAEGIVRYELRGRDVNPLNIRLFT